MNKVVLLSGNTPYELGLMHGKILKKEINSLISEITLYVKGYLPVFRIVPLDFVISLFASLLIFKFPKKYRDEMRGISKGSNVSIKKIVFLNSLMDIAHFLASMGLIEIKNMGCSAFLTTDTNGNLILAKTFDFSPAEIMAKYGKIFKYQCGWLQHGFCFYGFPGALAGDYYLNDNGVVGFFCHGGLTNSWKCFFSGQMSIPFLRDFYEKPNIETATNYFKNGAKPIVPYCAIISDGKQKSYLLNIFGDKRGVELFRGDPIFSTNHFTVESMEKYFLSRYKNNLFYKDSVARLNNLKRLVKKSIDLDDAKEILAYRSAEKHGSIANSLTAFAEIIILPKMDTYITSDKNVPVTLNKKYEKLVI